MADLHYDDFDGSPLPPASDARAEKIRRIVNLSGAVCSVALILGLGFWGYRLAVRDVTGVPVMRAMAGPMRVAPADPGGNQASHQGLSVNAVAATGTASPIVLAPRPVELQEGDLVALSAAQEAPETPLDTLSISGEATSGGETLLAADPETTAVDDAVALALEADAPLADVPEGALRVSLRPPRRPGALAETPAVVTDVQSVAAPAPAGEIDPAAPSARTRPAPPRLKLLCAQHCSGAGKTVSLRYYRWLLMLESNGRESSCYPSVWLLERNTRWVERRPSIRMT